MRYILIILLTIFTLNADDISEMELKKQIGRMLIVGFEDKAIDENSKIVKQIQKYDLGGVILFDRFYKDRARVKNIASPSQLKELTSKLQEFSSKPLIISIDQEGGRVARLKPAYGFTKILSAKDVSLLSNYYAKVVYDKQSLMLKENGINCNFAPVVDLDINPKNRVISGLERSFGFSAKKVTEYAKILIDAQRKNGIISVLKHFPGHGSSLGDSHKGFVDISKTWTKEELKPYQNLMDMGEVDMIMTAHVFNEALDEDYPSTLSYNTNTKLLRDEMNYKGVIISDDMQMGAIVQDYSLKESVTLGINSGVDILLFANQLQTQDLDELIDTIYQQVIDKKIPYSKILEANKRIENLHVKNSIRQRPIDFSIQRIEMTKAYIKQHYGFEVEDIIIEPKIIVLHWTAVMDEEDCFSRLDGDRLYSDRGDIVSAGSLNVSAHFLVARDGKITQLMPDNWMARHVIGLNYSTIGIENVGGQNNTEDDLTDAQVKANIQLVKYLKAKYPKIEYLIGHHEYMKMESHPLWLELDAGYRTIKADPGDRFMRDVREQVKDLELKKP